MLSLEQKNAQLREENRQLKKMLFGDFQVPWDWGLSPSQTSMFRCLVARPEVSYETLEDAVYGGRDIPENVKNIIRVQMRNLRLKLKPRNIQIHNRSGFGYHLDSKTRTRLRKTLQHNDTHRP